MNSIRALAFIALLFPAAAQTVLEPDAPGCVDSRVVSKLQFCRIDNCEKKDSDHRDIPVREDEKGEAIVSAVDGDSRSLMYECSVSVSPSDVVRQSAAALRAAGFDVPYQFVDKEGTLTAHKGDTWISLEAASRFYTLVEMKATSELESATDAVAMAEAVERYGHVPAYGVQFLSGRADLTPESAVALREIVAMMEDNSDWRVRVVGHTDNLGAKDANMTLSMRRATTVVNWLALHGVKRARLEVAGAGDSEPVAPNDSEANRARNRRIEIVKLPTPTQ